MDIWQKKLGNKFNKLKRGDDRSNCWRGRDIDLSKGNRGINIININNKGGELMITVNAALKDLEKIKADDNAGKVIKEVARILIKFLSTMRSNQLLTDEDKIRIQETRKARKPIDENTSKGTVDASDDVIKPEETVT